MINKRIFLLCILILSMGSALSAQTQTKSILRKGNKAYHKQDYHSAEQAYRSLLSRDSISGVANYALGSTLYQQGKDEEAKQTLTKALQSSSLTKDKQADILHNLGNISMKAKQYAEAIKNYEESLILNPTDDSTRYNLVLAQKLLQQRKQNQQQQDDEKQNDQNKDKQQQEQQNQDNNNQNKKQQPQEPEQDKNKQDKQNPDAKKPTEPQPQEGQLSRSQAEQILDAYKQNDDKTRRRVEQEQREQKQERNNKVRQKW